MGILGRLTGLEKETFGLDIGHENLKVAELKKSHSLFKLKTLGSSPSPKTPFAKKAITDKKALALAIKKAASDFHISADAAVSALPESLVFTKLIQMPKMKPNELQNSVPLEAASFIPLEPAQTYLDFQIVGEAQENYQILIVAAPKTLVDDFIETVKQAGFYLICLETKPMANARALVNEAGKEAILIIDIGAETTSLAIYDEKTIKFAVTFPIGGYLFARNIASALSIPLEKAEEMKKRVGIAKKGGEEIKKALSGPLDSLVDEIASGLKYYQGHKEKAHISKILLCGGGALMPGLANFVGEKIGLKTELGNPFQAIKNPPEKKENLHFTTAIGLGMRQV